MAKTTESQSPLENPLAVTRGGSESAASATQPWWRNLLEPKWIALFLVLSLSLPGLVFAYSHFRVASNDPSLVQGEVGLGEFRFVADARERSPIVAATFSLHLALLPETESLARERLVSRKYRVQQDVEELLRQAHGGDFEDPSLGDLKRQIQEQINSTLGVRVVDDVIVTNLDLQRSEQKLAADPSREVAGSPPWSD